MNVRRGAQNGVAQVAYAHQIEDREPLVRRLHEKIDIAVLASLIARHRSIQEQLSDAEFTELLTAFA